MLLPPLQAYLNDLNLEPPAAPSLAFIEELQKKHLAAYSFNNLAVVNGQGISLDTEDIAKKIVDNKLGGYCFEQNKLNFEALHALGYEVRMLLAKVIKQDLPNVPRTHRITLLKTKNTNYIIDVGFGGAGPISPLELVPGQIQQSGFERFQFVLDKNNNYELQLKTPEKTIPLYTFDLAQYSDADCEAANFYTEHYPESNFLKNLIFSIKNEHQIIVLRNHELTIRSNNGTIKKFISSPKELQNAILAYFKITIENSLAIDLFERFIANHLVTEEIDK